MDKFLLRRMSGGFAWRRLAVATTADGVLCNTFFKKYGNQVGQTELRRAVRREYPTSA